MNQYHHAWVSGLQQKVFSPSYLGMMVLVEYAVACGHKSRIYIANALNEALPYIVSKMELSWQATPVLFISAM